MLKKIVSLSLLLSVLTLSVKAQLPTKLVDKFEKEKVIINDKIYAHVNKSAYWVGETVWFKIYNFSNLTKQLSNLSKVAYVEILDDHQQPKVQVMVSLENGLGKGMLVLPSSLETGRYSIRAYTNLMKNAGESGFFQQSLDITNPNNLKWALSENKVDFYPEGGHLIENLKSKIAVRVTNNGMGLRIKGAIVNSKNDTVAVVKTSESGIGTFELQPKSNENYKFVAGISKDIIVKNLPPAQTAGYAIKLSESERYWDISVSANKSDGKVFVVIHNENKIENVSEFHAANGKLDFNFEKNSVESGLHNLVILDNSGKTLAKRIFFKPFGKGLALNATVSKPVYKQRQKIDLTISTSSIDVVKKDLNEPLYGSISVYKIDQFYNEINDPNLSWLALKSFGNGTIDLAETDAATMDDFLLTQDWKTYTWSENSVTMKFLPEHNGNLIQGKISSGLDRGRTLYLSSTKNPATFYQTKTDSSGNFIFNPGKLFGKHELIIQTDYSKDSTTQISINNPFYEGNSQSKSRVAAPLTFTKPGDQLQASVFANQVEKAYGQTPYLFVPNQIDTNMFYGSPDKTYVLSDYTKFNTLEDVLREYVSEITLIKRQKGFSLKIVGGDEYLKDNPLVLYDGIPYFDLDKMLLTNPDDIFKLDIVKSKYHYNGETYDGILHFRSKKANISDYYLSRNAMVVDYEGLQDEVKFQEVRYESEDSRLNPIPNYRSALYWNPDLVVKPDNIFTTSFFAPDLVGKYKVVIQAVSKSGATFSKILELDVVK
ncbi:hypothetical protein [Pedobacter sp.]